MTGGGTKLPRSSPCSNSSASQAASHTSVLRPGRILTCRALTSSSWKPRSSSTYQQGFQQLAGGLHHHLGDALRLQPIGQRLQARGERPIGAQHLAAPAGAIRHANAGHDLILADIESGAAVIDDLHRRHLLVMLVRRPAGPTDQATLKDVLAATVRGAGQVPASVLSTGSRAPRKAELGRAHRFSSLVAAPSHGGLIRYRGLSAVRTGVPQVAAERQGRSYAFLATSFQAVQASQTMPRAPSGTPG